jgi:hypothetical protein
MTLRATHFAAVALVLVPASASAGAGTSASVVRPQVALTASPSRVALSGAARATIRVTNSGSRRVVADLSRAGFALDLRGRPKIVGAVGRPRSAAGWLAFRPHTLAIRPGGAAPVTIISKLPSKPEPGDHDALLLVTTRRRVQDGVAVRMRMGIVVVVRAPGTVVRRLEMRSLRVERARGARVLELLLANRGNVTEAIDRSHAVVSLFLRGRRIARLTADPRELRPRTRGIVQFRYRGGIHGLAIARADVSLEGTGRVLRRTFRVRL